MVALDSFGRRESMHNNVVTLAIALIGATGHGATIGAKFDGVATFIATIPSAIFGARFLAPFPVAIVAAKGHKVDQIAARVVDVVIVHSLTPISA